MKSSQIFYSLVSAVFLSFSTVVAHAQTDTVDVSTMTQNERYQYAEALRRGNGVDVDLEQALEIHRQLARDGRSQSFVRMADILVLEDRFPEALNALEAGKAAGSDFASMRLAMWHTQQRFGALSDPEYGVNELVRITETSDNINARYVLARAYEDGTGTEINLDNARKIYEELASEGHGRSLHQLGNLARDGAFSAPDPAAAAAFYQSAAENGSRNSWLTLARLQKDLNNYQSSIDAYSAAIAADVRRANSEFLRSHFLNEFGVLSDRNFGAQQLKTNAENGDVDAATEVLRLWERRSRRINSLDLEAVLEMLDAKMREGDTQATATLARAYRVLRWRIPQARARHASLVENYGDQLGRSKTLEVLFSTYDTGNHAESRVEAYELVSKLNGREFNDGARAVRSTDSTAFVYLLQRELGKLGYLDGPATSRFDSRTLRATLDFCADRGIMDTCKHGPLAFSAAKDIIQELAEARG